VDEPAGNVPGIATAVCGELGTEACRLQRLKWRQLLPLMDFY